MKKNTGKFVTKAGAPIPEHLRFRGHQSAAVAADGSINASDVKDLMGQIGRLLQSAQNGDIVRESQSEVARATAAERREILAEALADTSGELWRAVGEAMTEDIFETTGREGFARKLMAFKEIVGAEVARVRFRQRDVVAYYAATASEVVPTFVRNNYKYLPEFYIHEKILAEERDIAQSSGDVLEEKYQEGLEAIMTGEDRLWKTMADTAAAAVNVITYFTTLTPSIFSQVKSKVTGWSIPAAYCVLAYDLWDDIIGTAGFSDWFDPIHQHELILEGQLGRMLGLNVLTDGFRLPELKVLDPGEFYVVGAPELHGSLQQRGDLSSNPINDYDKGAPMRGWYVWEIVAMMIVNAKSVAAGKRTS